VASGVSISGGRVGYNNVWLKLRWVTDLTDELPVHHISVFTSGNILVDNSHDGNHRQASVVELLVLVVNPAIIAVINPVSRTKKIPRDVSGSLLDLLSKPFDSTATEDKLNPSNNRKLSSGLKGIVGEGTVESRVHTSGVEVPS